MFTALFVFMGLVMGMEYSVVYLVGAGLMDLIIFSSSPNNFKFNKWGS
jgi:hypothetical protein